MYAPRSVRSTRALVIGTVAIFSLACGSDSVTGTTSLVTGTYSLQTINGAALPFTLTDTVNGIPATVTFMSPSIYTLSADHSVRIIMTVRLVYGTINEIQADTEMGTWALNGSQLTFSQPGSTSFTGTWNGSDMLTTAQDGMAFVFKK